MLIVVTDIQYTHVQVGQGEGWGDDCVLGVAWIGGCLEGGCQGRWEGCARVVDGKVTARVDV